MKHVNVNLVTMFNQYQLCVVCTFTLWFFGSVIHGWLCGLLIVVTFVGSIILTSKHVYSVVKLNKCLNSSWIVSVLSCISQIRKAIVSLWEVEVVSPVVDQNPEAHIDHIVDLIVRDFLISWFKEISPNSDFLGSGHLLLTRLTKLIVTKFEHTDLDRLLEKFVILFNKHLQQYQRAVHLLNRQPRFRLKRDHSQEFRKLKSIEEVFEYEETVHFAFENKCEILYLKSVLEVCFMSVKADDALAACRPGYDLLSEIVTTNALFSLLDLVSDPNFLHFCIIKLTSDEAIEEVSEPEISSILNGHTDTDGDRENPVEFFLSEESSFDPGERPSPVGCSEEESVFEYSCSRSTESSEISPIDVAERNGLFDMSFLSSSVSSGIIEPEIDCDVEQAEDVWSKAPERFEQPLNLVIEVNITRTERLREYGTLGFYTIYLIEYLAWYKTSQGTWHVCNMTVRRRYREFVALQERIEEHPMLKKYLKKIQGIKGPSKWLNLPFNRMDEAHIEKRRVFLQNYLRSIIDCRELSYCLAVREFLAYEGNPGIAFVRKPSDVQRLDQVVVQTVKNVGNVIERFTERLPGLGDSRPTLAEAQRSRMPSSAFQESMFSPTFTTPGVQDGGSPETTWPTGKDPHALKIRLQPSSKGMHQSIYFKKLQHAIEMFDSPPDNQAASLSDALFDCIDDTPFDYHDATQYVSTVNDDSVLFQEAEPRVVFHEAGEKKRLRYLAGLVAETESEAADPEDEVGQQVPLAWALLRLALQTVAARDCWVQSQRAVRLFLLLLGNFLQAFVRKELREATTRARCAHYLWELSDTLWPAGALDRSPRRQPSAEQRAHTRAQARRCLYSFFPGVLPYVIGREDFAHAVDEVMAVLNHSRLNRHLGLCLLDVLVEELFPEIRTAELQSRLLQDTHQHYTRLDCSP